MLEYQNCSFTINICYHQNIEIYMQNQILFLHYLGGWAIVRIQPNLVQWGHLGLTLEWACQIRDILSGMRRLMNQKSIVLSTWASGDKFLERPNLVPRDGPNFLEGVTIYSGPSHTLQKIGT